MQEELPTSLAETLNQLAARVGFKQVGALGECHGIAPPRGALVWESCYAILAVVPVATRQAQQITAMVEHAKRWMLNIIVDSEHRGVFIDGYLVVALDEAPDDSLRAVAQKIVTDTTVCRKHVIWPERGIWDERLSAITSLALPEIEAISNVVARPELPPIAGTALNLYQFHKAYETVADELRAMVIKAAEKEETHAT